MELTWAFVPADTSNRTVSYSFDMNALNYFDLVKLSNGIKLTDKASTHKRTLILHLRIRTGSRTLRDVILITIAVLSGM